MIHKYIYIYYLNNIYITSSSQQPCLRQQSRLRQQPRLCQQKRDIVSTKPPLPHMSTKRQLQTLKEREDFL